METLRIRIEDADPNGRVKKYKEKAVPVLIKIALSVYKRFVQYRYLLKKLSLHLCGSGTLKRSVKLL